MRLFFILLFFFLLSNCTRDKFVYWCGDHACVNDKERIAYFEKTMIVEIKDISKKNKKDISKEKKIKKQILQNEKKIKKQARLDEKIKRKDEKELKKQAKLNKKKLKKKFENKKEDKKISETKLLKNQVPLDSNNIDEIYQALMDNNINKPFPDINDFPE